MRNTPGRHGHSMVLHMALPQVSHYRQSRRRSGVARKSRYRLSRKLYPATKSDGAEYARPFNAGWSPRPCDIGDLYSTGIRRRNSCGLDVYDLDWERGVMTAKARAGKIASCRWASMPRVDRSIPGGRPAATDGAPDEREVFLGYGAGLLPYVGNWVHDRGAVPHRPRRQLPLIPARMATLMLENGADLPLRPANAWSRPAEHDRDLHARQHPETD